MLRSERLLALQRKHGLPEYLSKHMDWGKRIRAIRRWLKGFPHTTVYTVTGPVERPLVPYQGYLTDIATGTQFFPNGVCRSSLQMALHPFKYITKPPEGGRNKLARAADTHTVD